MTGYCALAGKTGGAIRVCLEFLAPPFASRQKVDKPSIHFKSNVLAAAPEEPSKDTGIAFPGHYFNRAVP